MVVSSTHGRFQASAKGETYKAGLGANISRTGVLKWVVPTTDQTKGPHERDRETFVVLVVEGSGGRGERGKERGKKVDGGSVRAVVVVVVVV